MKTSYGCLHDEIEIDGELSKKIINVIEQHINEKKEEFEKLQNRRWSVWKLKLNYLLQQN